MPAQVRTGTMMSDVHLICDVQHPAVHGRRGPSDDGVPRPLTQSGKLVHFLLHCDKNVNILHMRGMGRGTQPIGAARRITRRVGTAS